MRYWQKNLLCLGLLSMQGMLPLLAQPVSNGAANTKEAAANTQAIPKPILKSGVVLNARGLSANTLQFANIIGLATTLERIRTLSSQLESSDVSGRRTPENLYVRQDLWDARQKASLIIQKTSLDVDFALAEIESEQRLYDEILDTFTSDRDKLVARVNAPVL